MPKKKTAVRNPPKKFIMMYKTNYGQNISGVVTYPKALARAREVVKDGSHQATIYEIVPIYRVASAKPIETKLVKA